MGKTRGRLVPQKITYVLWLSDDLTDDAASRLIEDLKAAGQLTAIASQNGAKSSLAAAAGLPFITGNAALADLMRETCTKDWILTRDCAAPDYFHKLIETCVFNTGVVYRRQTGAGPVTFFNVRASSLEAGGDLFNIGVKYPARKKVDLKHLRSPKSTASLMKVCFSGASTSDFFNWAFRLLSGRPIPRGPFGAINGNKVVNSL